VHWSLNTVKEHNTMHIHVDLARNVFTFEFGDFSGELAAIVTPIDANWSCASTPSVQIDSSTYSLVWKTWRKHEQFVEVQVFQPEDQRGWHTVASWSCTTQPQAGTSQTRAVKHFGLKGTVTVTGSPYGDWKA
jgi:hypothetical protein